MRVRCSYLNELDTPRGGSNMLFKYFIFYYKIFE